MAGGWQPTRSCVACRRKRPKGELLRFVLSGDAELTPDFGALLPGRGAYLCKEKGCIESISRPEAFMRAFRLKSPPGVSGRVREYVFGLLEKTLN
jgi:predicted RNA-binding protein YlxR (DUF448 family)